MEPILVKLEDKEFAAWAAIRLCGGMLQIYLYDGNTLMSHTTFRMEKEGTDYVNAKAISFPPFVGNVTHFEIHSLSGLKLSRGALLRPRYASSGSNIQFGRGVLSL